jgi:histone acetyltransferase 1
VRYLVLPQLPLVRVLVPTWLNNGNTIAYHISFLQYSEDSGTGSISANISKIPVIVIRNLTMSDQTDSDDEPRFSSAAQCISLHMLGQTFSPEYTHQCFDGEWIRGYQPFQIAAARHPTHVNHEGATHELLATIVLSPSCEAAHVNFAIRCKKRERQSGKVGRQKKFLKLEHDSAGSETDDEDAGDDCEDEVDGLGPSIDADKDLNTEDDHSDAGKTRHRRMHPDEITERLAKALPPLADDKSLIVDDYLRQPIGKIRRAYSRQGKHDDNEEFIVTIADSEQAADYHSRVQNLAILFIENADGVNLHQSNGGGYWRVLYLFKKHGTRRYSLCGYVTLFHFSSPFRKPKAGIVMRICQVLLLPPYQRRGHGKILVRTVHELANESDDIVEINVEDPAPGFVALRNRVDYEMLVESVESENPWLPSHYLQAGCFSTLREIDISRAASLGCITPRQVQIAYELYKLQEIPQGADDKEFRLMVKKRLLKLHRERLSSFKTKKERQAFLAELWREVHSEYNAILKRK